MQALGEQQPPPNVNFVYTVYTVYLYKAEHMKFIFSECPTSPTIYCLVSALSLLLCRCSGLLKFTNIEHLTFVQFFTNSSSLGPQQDTCQLKLMYGLNGSEDTKTEEPIIYH